MAPRNPINDPSIAKIEEIARAASAATLAAVTQQQAVMVEKMTTLTERITDLADLMKTSLVRKEEFVGMKDKTELAIATLESRIDKAEGSIMWTARTVGGAIVAGALAFLFKQ